MRSTARDVRLATVLALLACLTVLLAGSALADGSGAQRIGGHHGGFVPLPPLVGPAGPTPLDPAGPTPLNPAGPTPLNPTGRSMGMPRRAVPIQQPGVFVGVVGASDAGLPLRGSFFCQVHNRGYASQSLFFDHLAVADGVGSEDAMSYLIEDGGVWVVPVV
jgi:hypothetical protein